MLFTSAERIRLWLVAHVKFFYCSPQVVTEYNQFICHLDKLNFLISLYPLLAKTRK